MIFDKLFKKEKPKERNCCVPVNLSRASSGFHAWNGTAYENDIFRAGIDAIARNGAKLKPVCIVQSGSVRKETGGKLNRLLQVQPNEYMNTFDLLYKTFTYYYIHNNAFLYVQRESGDVSGIYPINASSVKFYQDPEGKLFCKFFFPDGSNYILPYSDIIHLRRHFNSNDLLGDDNNALYPALQLANAQNEGIVSGIENGANIRGILHFTQIMNPDTLKEEKRRFTEDYLTISNQGGVVVTDQKMEYTPINVTPPTIDADQLKATREKVFNYLGISECIVNSTYNENEWAAFYESVIEPVAVQLGLEFTRKLFTKREQAFGNQIVFESSRLQFTSNATKVNLIKELMPYGLLTINQALDILNLPAVPDGDRRLQTLNVVDTEIAKQYQLKGAQEAKP